MTENEFDYDKSMLERIIKDVGKHAYGIIGIEVWTMDDNGITLSQSDGGFWVDEVFAKSQTDNGKTLELLDNSDVEPVPPGFGIAGFLFSEAADFTYDRRAGGVIPSALEMLKTREISSSHWYDLQSFLDDEDQPYDEHTNLILEMGFGKAFGVPFYLDGLRGITIFYARSSADENAIFDQLRRIYLFSAVDMISSALWMRNVRRAVAVENKAVVRKVKDRLKVIKHCVGASNVFNLRKDTQDDTAQSGRSNYSKYFINCWNSQKTFGLKDNKPTKDDNPVHHKNQFNHEKRFKSKVQIFTKKCFGAGKKTPPRKSARTAIFTFFSVLIQLLIITKLDNMFLSVFGYGFLRGTFGSNATSYFLLTASPSTQPRAFIIGHTLCSSIAITMRYLITPVHICASLAVATSATMMAAVGVITPSATALTVRFAYDSSLGWPHVGILLIQNIIMVLTATFLNNLSSERQYPSYWTIITWPKVAIKCKDVLLQLFYSKKKDFNDNDEKRGTN